jgi:hypothetical protein
MSEFDLRLRISSYLRFSFLKLIHGAAVVYHALLIAFANINVSFFPGIQSQSFAKAIRRA